MILKPSAFSRGFFVLYCKKSSDMKKLIQLCIIAVILSACSSDKRENTGNFKWDFSTEGKEYTYSYKQTVVTSNSYDQEEIKSPRGDLKMKGEGKFFVGVKKHNMADFVLTDLLLTSESDGKEQSMGGTEMKFRYVSDNGIIDDKDQEILLYSMFPLPQDSIGIGEKSTIKCHIPIRLQNEVIYSEGEIILTLEKFEVIDGHKCAVFSSKLEIKEEGKNTAEDAKYKVHTVGSGMHKFDMERKCYVETIADLDMNFSFSDSIDEESDSKSSTNISSKNHFDIKLIDINN